MPIEKTCRISVAMCTYNGERFLPQQLESIAAQTRLPDELIVSDDGSTDRTVSLIRQFAESVSFPVRLSINTQNLGFSANFAKAMQQCEGDLIALSDHDDIWYPNRLERSEIEMNNHPHVGLVFSDADLMDENSHMLGQTIWERLGLRGNIFEQLSRGDYLVLARHRFVTGATVTFRANLRDRCLPIAPGWVHDEWIAMCVAAFSTLLPVKEPFIRYRVHGSQQIGFVNKLERRAQADTPAETHWRRVRESAAELRQLCDFLLAQNVPSSNPVLAAYLDHLRFLDRRATLPAGRSSRAWAIARELPRYRLHASGISSALKDLALARRS
jgi:glycosyltransferase involved in cell wall biosynthesis